MRWITKRQVLKQLQGSFLFGNKFSLESLEAEESSWGLEAGPGDAEIYRYLSAYVISCPGLPHAATTQSKNYPGCTSKLSRTSKASETNQSKDFDPESQRISDNMPPKESTKGTKMPSIPSPNCSLDAWSLTSTTVKYSSGRELSRG